MALDLAGVAVSTGAACAAGAVEPSHVLRAMGLPLERVQGSLRFSLGRGTPSAQVDRAAAVAEARGSAAAGLASGATARARSAAVRPGASAAEASGALARSVARPAARRDLLVRVVRRAHQRARLHVEIARARARTP